MGEKDDDQATVVADASVTVAAAPYSPAVYCLGVTSSEVTASSCMTAQEVAEGSRPQSAPVVAPPAATSEAPIVAPSAADPAVPAVTVAERSDGHTVPSLAATPASTAAEAARLVAAPPPGAVAAPEAAAGAYLSEAADPAPAASAVAAPDSQSHFVVGVKHPADKAWGGAPAAAAPTVPASGTAGMTAALLPGATAVPPIAADAGALVARTAPPPSH